MARAGKNPLRKIPISKTTMPSDSPIAVACVPKVERLESVSIVLPVMNETIALAETVEIASNAARMWIKEFLIVVCDRTAPASMVVVKQLQAEYGELIVVHRQTLPHLGGAIREAFDRARGSHVLLMASDMETDPNMVGAMIVAEEKNPSGIVTASRWLEGGSFHGYSKIKLACNWMFQRLFALLYRTHLTDMTYAFRIFPTKLVQAIRWEELRHPFLFETMVKPLRLGVPVVEIPAIWIVRPEGESQNTFFRNFAYFRIGLKTLWTSKKKLLRSPDA
jgi:hypothetical protein